MSLKRRLDRIEAAADWLRFDGWALLCQRQMEVLDRQRRYDEAMARKQRAEEQATAAAATAARRAQQAAALTQSAPQRATEAASPPEPAHTEPPLTEPPPVAPPPPPPDATDIPEHMQIRPTHWRFPSAEDYDEDGHDPYTALTEYDPLKPD